MDVQSSGSHKIARSQQRLASYGKAMVFLQRLVLKRWAEGVRLVVQQRAQQEHAETVAAADAAAEAAERKRLTREVESLRAAAQLSKCRDPRPRSKGALVLAKWSLAERRQDDERMTERAPKRPHEPCAAADSRQRQPEVAGRPPG
jgi:hypothetical protein